MISTERIKQIRHGYKQLERRQRISARSRVEATTDEMISVLNELIEMREAEDVSRPDTLAGMSFAIPMLGAVS